MKKPNKFAFNKKQPFYVGVFVRHPHFDDTGFDTEILVPFQLMWGHTTEEMMDYARSVLAPPHIDPALISVTVEPLKYEDLEIVDMENDNDETETT